VPRAAWRLTPAVPVHFVLVNGTFPIQNAQLVKTAFPGPPVRRAVK
jgi:hypothetical protein